MEKLIEEMTELRLEHARMTTALRIIIEVCNGDGCRCIGGIYCSTCEARAAALAGLRKI